MNKRTIFISLVLLIVITTFGWRFMPRAPLAERFQSSTAVYDANGRLLRLMLSADDKYRVWVSLQNISPILKDAVLLHEDQYFYRHFGINPLALLRATWKTLSGGRKQGGSTVSMQVVRKLYNLNSRTVSGKLTQLIRAIQLEFNYSKDEILEAYLNLVPFSQNIEGVAAASLIYFSKRADKLTLPEALTLAVIPQSPLRRDPSQVSTEPLWKARIALYRKWKLTYDVTKSDAALIDLPLAIRNLDDLPFRAPHFVARVLNERDTGTQVNTTLDFKLQGLLERHVKSYVQQQNRFGVRNAAAMLVDYRTMEVKALVGSADFFNNTIDGQVNGTLAKRSPGSTLKPFIYALAIDQGIIHPLSILKDAPINFGAFNPENFDGQFVGPISAQDALIRSRNVPAVTIAAKLASPSFYDFLKSSGIAKMQSENHYGLSLVLGGGELTMEELVALYAMLANRGVLKPLRMTAENIQSQGVRVLSDEASFMTLEMLKENPRPDHLVYKHGNDLPVYWKTGTSYGFRDAWSIGIAGSYVIAVWIGNFNGESNPALIGGQMAAPLFFQLIDSLQAHHGGLREPLFRSPRNAVKLEVCAASGDLPNTYCPVRATTWFIPGKSPIKVSELHRPVLIDNRTGLSACPGYQGAVHTEIFEFWPSDMQRLFIRAGIPRRSVPSPVKQCLFANAVNGKAPKIVSPVRGLTYELRMQNKTNESIGLQASTDGDVSEIFWFVNDSFIGKARRGNTLHWMPPGAGSYLIRAVDEMGRADSRDLKISISQ